MDAQDPIATAQGLTGFAGRGAGTDAERRAANWLAGRCSAAGREVEIETFWCRPNWALAHLWHVALAFAGGLIALASPITSIVLLALALTSVTADAIFGISLGRRLSPERASQNVIATGPREATTAELRTQLVLAANYDAGRLGLAYRLRSVTTRVTAATHGLTPGWLGWLCLAIVWLLAVAIVRQAGHTSQLVGLIQLPPTVGLLLGFALLLELATANWSPAAGDNASGVAAALEVANALSTAPPQHLQVKLVLAGAGDAEQIGLGRHLHARRRRQRGLHRRLADTIVLGLAASSAGTPHWWQSDGALLPLRYSALLRRTAAQIAEDEPHMRARLNRGRGASPALPARLAGLPGLTIGCLDADGRPPRSHRSSDTPDAVDPLAIDATVQFALLLVDAIDAAVARTQRRPSATPA